MEFRIIDDKGKVVGTIKKSYLSKFVDPKKEYDVNYLTPHQSMENKRECGFFKLHGEDLTENQIWELFLSSAL